MNMKGHDGKGVGFGILHPLNRKFEELPLTKEEEVRGKVVRLRKNF